MLSAEGSETGASSRASAAAQSARNVFFGSRSIASARMTVMTRIMTPPARLICRSFMPAASFQLADDLPQPLELLGGELFPPQQGREQLVGRAVIDLVDQFICFRLLDG